MDAEPWAGLAQGAATSTGREAGEQSNSRSRGREVPDLKAAPLQSLLAATDRANPGRQYNGAFAPSRRWLRPARFACLLINEQTNLLALNAPLWVFRIAKYLVCPAGDPRVPKRWLWRRAGILPPLPLVASVQGARSRSPRWFSSGAISQCEKWRAGWLPVPRLFPLCSLFETSCSLRVLEGKGRKNLVQDRC